MQPEAEAAGQFADGPVRYARGRLEDHRAIWGELGVNHLAPYVLFAQNTV